MTEKSDSYRGKFTRVKTAKGRKTASTRWLNRQLNDPYVIKSKMDGYRSRAAYKLIEINKKFNIIKPGMNIVDLGAAPGGWSQVGSNIVQSNKKGAKNKVIAIDLIDIDTIVGVTNFKADFCDEETKQMIIDELPGNLADCVISDMAANTTGHNQTDHLRVINLCEDAFLFSMKILKPGGHFVAKVFKGGAEGDLLTKLKQNFSSVKHFKPESSRKESSELYLVAIGKKT